MQLFWKICAGLVDCEAWMNGQRYTEGYTEVCWWNLEGSWVSIYLSAPAGSSLRRPQEAHWTSWSLALWIWFSVLSLQRQLSFSAFNFSRCCSLCITGSAQCIPPRSAKSQAKLHPISSKFNANLRKGYTLQALNSMRMHLYGTWGPNF